MKTEKDVLDFLISLGINEKPFMFSGHFYLAMALKHSDHKRITDFGLVAGFGDAFEYEGKGVVVLGHSNIGKTSIVKEFERKEGCRILAENELSLYDSNNDGLHVLQYPHLETHSWKETLEKYANSIATSKGPKLSLILHLNGEDVFDSEDFVDPHVNQMLKFFYTLPNGLADKYFEKMFSYVALLEYVKDYGYSDDRHLHETFTNIINGLKQAI